MEKERFLFGFCVYSWRFFTGDVLFVGFFFFFFPVLGAKVFLVQGHVNDMSYLKNVFQSTSREI